MPTPHDPLNETEKLFFGCAAICFVCAAIVGTFTIFAVAGRIIMAGVWDLFTRQ